MVLPDNDITRQQAWALVNAGGLVAFRTDTFYGLGVDPFNPSALRALKRLKGREDHKPILVIISDEMTIDRFMAQQSEIFRTMRAHFWPGPLTLVAEARTDLPDELTAGTGTIGVRLPDDEQVRGFVRACGGALTATSANRAGELPARTAQEVARAFPDGVGLIVDGGETQCEQPSSVLKVSAAGASLLREGLISREALAATLRTIGVQLD